MSLDHQRSKRQRLLESAVIVDAFAGIARKVGWVYVPHHAHDGRPRLASTAYVFSERVLIRPILTRQILVDDRHWLCALPVLSRKVSAALERNPHSFEIARRDPADIAVRTGVIGAPHPTFDSERSGAAHSAEREGNPGRSRRDPTRAGQPFQHRAIKHNALFRLFILRGWQRESRRHHAAGVKSRIHLLQPRQASQKQPCAHQQHHSQRPFANHQRRAQALPAVSGRCGTARGLEDFVRIDPRDLPARREPKQNPREDRHRRREQQRADVDASVQSNDGIFRRQRQKQAHSGVGDPQPRYRAGRRQQQTLRNHLLDELAPSGPQRRPHGNLPGAA